MNETSKQILLNSNIRKDKTTQDVFILRAGVLKDNKTYTVTASRELTFELWIEFKQDTPRAYTMHMLLINVDKPYSLNPVLYQKWNKEVP